MSPTNKRDDRYFSSPFEILTTSPMQTSPKVVRATTVVTLPQMEVVSNDVAIVADFEHFEQFEVFEQ